MIWRRRSRRPVPENAVEQEISFHIAELTEAYVRLGLPPDEARRRAILEFGGREQVKQQVREVHLSALLESVLFNLKSAVRFLRKSLSFSVVVIVTLGLGIGANSAVFSAIDAIILRALPFPVATSWLRFISTTTRGATPTHSSLLRGWKTGTG